MTFQATIFKMHVRLHESRDLLPEDGKNNSFLPPTQLNIPNEIEPTVLINVTNE